MFRNSSRYNEYYLVNDMEMEEMFEEPEKKCCTRKCLCVGITVICVLVTVFLVIFVGFPLVFMNSITLQQDLIFTHFNLPSSEEHFEKYYLPGYRNKYVVVKDVDGVTNKSLGVWQMLPIELTYASLHQPDFDYDQALLNSSFSVLIYFHGTGESRSDNTRKYDVLRYFFHVIAFDYRSYADSSKGTLSEKAVVNDCIQLYEWVRNRTYSPIYIWGHSLGAAIAADTVLALERLNMYPQGLVIESAFTSLRDEMYFHPYAKIFSWLPWFTAMVVDPLTENGFVFDNKAVVANVSCPMLILHAEDDGIVPYRFGKKLFEIAYNRTVNDRNVTFYYQFERRLGYNHYFIYQDLYLKYFIMDFIAASEDIESNAVDSA